MHVTNVISLLTRRAAADVPADPSPPTPPSEAEPESEDETGADEIRAQIALNQERRRKVAAERARANAAVARSYQLPGGKK